MNDGEARRTTSKVSDGFLAILGLLLLSALLLSCASFRGFAASAVGLLFYFVAPATGGAFCLGALFLPRSWRPALAFNAAIGLGFMVGGSLYLESVAPEKGGRHPNVASGSRWTFKNQP
jgi:MFS family permease